MDKFQIRDRVLAMESIQMLIIKDNKNRQYHWDGTTLYRATPIKGEKSGRKPKSTNTEQLTESK